MFRLKMGRGIFYDRENFRGITQSVLKIKFPLEKNNKIKMSKRKQFVFLDPVNKNRNFY